MFQKKKSTIMSEEDTRGNQKAVKEETFAQYFSIHGTVPDSVVAAKSRLCEDIH